MDWKPHLNRSSMDHHQQQAAVQARRRHVSAAARRAVANQQRSPIRYIAEKYHNVANNKLQAITHLSSVYLEFGKLNLTPPATFGDVALCMEGVNRTLAQINEWTQKPSEMSHADWEALYTASGWDSQTASEMSETSISYSDTSFTSSVTSPTSPGMLCCDIRLEISPTTGTPDPVQMQQRHLITSVSGTSLPHASPSTNS